MSRGAGAGWTGMGLRRPELADRRFPLPQRAT